MNIAPHYFQQQWQNRKKVKCRSSLRSSRNSLDSMCQHFNLYLKLKKQTFGVFLVIQWLRTCLPMQGTRIASLVWEDPTYCEKQSVSHNYWTHRRQLLRPALIESVLRNKRSHCNENALQLESCPHSPQLEETCARGKDPVQPKINHYVGAKVIMAFTLLKFAIWYWSTFLTKCGYVIHHFNMHLSLCVFWLMTYYLLCVLYLF